MPKQFISNFSGGEVSSDLYGRYDSELYRSALIRMENFIARMQGPSVYRGSTRYVHPSRLQETGRIETFVYNDEQAYLVFLTDSVIRIVEDSSITIEASGDVISGATQAAECVITATGHSFSDDDEVYIDSVVGMTELNGRFFRVSDSTANTFKIKDLFGNYADSTGFTAYSSAGAATGVYEVASPYDADEIEELQFAQQGNEMTFTHNLFEPYKLIRVSATSWTMGTFARTNDPFTGAGLYPACVTYYEGRCYYARSIDNPDTIWASRGPDNSGVQRYNDFTTGADDDHAIIRPISSTAGNVEFINWIAPSRDFILVGTTRGMNGIDGGGNSAITPSNFRVRPLDPFGVQAIRPVLNGDVAFYIQKGGLAIRSLEYSLLSDAFKSFDRSFVSKHLPIGGIKEVAFQRGRSDILWAVRYDGVLIGTTIKEKEDVSGWHRHTPAGEGKVISIAIEPQVEGYDRVNLLVERTINGVTTNYLEYFTEPFQNLERADYYSGDTAADKTIDDAIFANEVFEAQRNVQYLDSHLVWDGSADRGAITITPSAVTGTGVVFTASSSLFEAGDEGKEIQKKYQNKVGGGRAEITAVNSDTEVECNIYIDFDNTDAIPAGDWYLTSDEILGAHHWEGETIQVVADGRVKPDVVISGGVASLDEQAAIVVLGKSYRGVNITLPIVAVAALDNNLSAPNNISQIAILFTDSIGGKYGTSMYRMQEVFSSKAGQLPDRPPLPATAIRDEFYEDSWEELKSIVVVQDQPYPLTVNSINVEIDSGA